LLKWDSNGIKAKVHTYNGPGGGNPVIHLSHKDPKVVHAYAKKHIDPDVDLSDHKINEALKGNQHRLDVNDNGELDPHDFKLLRNRKKKKVAEEAKLAAQRVLQEPSRFYYEQAEAGSRINANSASTIKTDIDAKNNLELRSPSTDPYWYRDIKSGAKGIFDKFLQKTPKESFPWSLKGRR
jgi:hypothetical protein